MIGDLEKNVLFDKNRSARSIRVQESSVFP